MSVKERLTKYAKTKERSVRAFEIKAGLTVGYINAIRVSIQPDKIQRIASHYPDLNTEWLMTGEGEMLKTGNIKVAGDGNISNTGIIEGGVSVNSEQEIKLLKARVKELENDKAILQEYVTFLLEKKKKKK